MSRFKQLRPRTRVYTDSSGTSELLLCIYGNLGSDSSLPVLIWIPRSYRIEHPLIYVDLETLAGAPHALEQYVTANGEIRLPVLEQWNAETNNISDIVESLINLAAPAADGVTNASISPPPRPLSESSAPHVPPRPPRPPRPFDSSAGASREMSPRPPKIPIREDPLVNRPSHTAAPQIPERPPLTYSADLLDSELGAKHDLRHKEALKNLQRTLNELTLHDSHSVQQNIEARKLAIEAAVKQFELTLDYEKASLQRTFKAIENTTAVLSRETQDIERQAEQVQKYEEIHGETPDPSSLMATENAVLNQLYELVAKDCALTDAVHTLGRLLNAGKIKLDIFVKKTRGLARQQFLIRMHIKKVMNSLGQP